MTGGILFSPLDLNEPADPGDQFPYGWRDVPGNGKDGLETTVRVPLTLDDILHPQEGDHHLLSDPHTEDTLYLRVAFRRALANISGTLVLNDCRVEWNRSGDLYHSPDCTVIFNVRKKKNWRRFNAVREKTIPALIIEVTSPRTRSTDLVNKVSAYAAQGVSHYVIADARESDESRRISLIDYHLTGRDKVYVSLPLSDDGRIWLREVNLWLGTEDGRLVCDDADGKRIPPLEEQDREIVEAKQAAEKERKLREKAETKAARAEAKAAQERAAFEARIKKLEEQLRKDQ